MRGTVTAKKVVEADKWLAKMQADEKQLKFIMGRKENSVSVTFYLRSEKLISKYKSAIKKNEDCLLRQGWDVGYTRLSYNSRDICVTAMPSDTSSFLELKFKFYIYEEALAQIRSKTKFISDTLNFFRNNIPDLKCTMDIKYSVDKLLNVSEQDMIDILMNLGYDEKRTLKGNYRKFKVIGKHNVTDSVDIKMNNKYLDAEIRIYVENIVIDEENLDKELEYSLYYFVIEYFKLHYKVVSLNASDFVESQKDFYETISSNV